MVCAPGCADFGISTVCVKFPPASTVLEPAVEASNSRLTGSPAVNPEPEKVALVVGVPMAGGTETEAAKAKLALALKARITINAREDGKLRVMGANLQSWPKAAAYMKGMAGDVWELSNLNSGVWLSAGTVQFVAHRLSY